ncbi:hypothetical protein [Flavobacterium ginsenosidimutans]|uniref:Uncharacterized protein n=1 Tax=Flavobacterium ginsenosidimutans TaxID=687844 RepID=A0ABZ2QD49_9FLAO|nr:hypothetical protein [Flavobacterium ginsenosidimutans]KAF2332940.1 hypothetical protein DM444_09025 [Flavobacterium ginsenosidimutans]
MFRIFLIIILIANTAFSQKLKETPQSKYYNFCRSDLSKIERIPQFPFFPTEELCSIKKCFRSISYKEINEVIYNRLIEIAQKNYSDGILLYLLEGDGSAEEADKKNKKTNNNKFIYVSIDDFINSEEISKGKDLYNNETKKLMNKI